MYTVVVRKYEKYPREYIKLWRNMVPDVVIVGEDVEFDHHFGGWNCILEIFSPDFKYRPCVYFDLDTYILGDISALYKEPDQLMLIRDFNQTRRGNSGVMILPENVDKYWNVLQHTQDNDPAGNAVDRLPHGYLQDKHPGMISSYKVDKCQDKRPESPIMCFHGKPKPHTAEGWAGDFWKSHT